MRPLFLAARLALGAVLLGSLSLGTACAPAEERTLVLQVGGMVCESCSQAITAALTKQPGVLACTVDHVSGRAEVRHDPARIDAATIAATITRMGYTATPAPP